MLILSKKQRSSRTCRTQQAPHPPQGWGPDTDAGLKDRAGWVRGDLKDLISSCFPANPSSRRRCLNSCSPFWSGPGYTLSSARNPALASQVTAPQSEDIVRAADGCGWGKGRRKEPLWREMRSFLFPCEV